MASLLYQWKKAFVLNGREVKGDEEKRKEEGSSLFQREREERVGESQQFAFY